MAAKDLNAHARLSVAPMMDWTDRHCRYFHRLISRNALLYTEMIAAPALVRGGALHLLDHHENEHPVAVQLGGSEADELGEAARIAAASGYNEINLNVGCPSDRVQSGCFGAVLMKEPDRVAHILDAMQAASTVEVTVKCRIGVDDQDPQEVLPDFLSRVSATGVRRVAIHARKAWLQGLSPKENREVPPLDYALVSEMKERFPYLHISLNGGLQDFEEAVDFLGRGLDGVMFGRAAYQRPWDILAKADERIFGARAQTKERRDIVCAMGPYIEAHLNQGGKLSQITRHMLGLFAGTPGARSWRRILSQEATKPGADLETLERALDAVEGAASAAA